MLKAQERKKGQKGFTLIEIIAVLVILGILAAVAIPRYLDMQAEAAKRAVQGGLGALASQVTLNYASAVLATPAVATSWTPGTASSTVGDFVGSAAVSVGTVTLTITGGLGAGATAYSQVSGSAAALSSSFKLY